MISSSRVFSKGGKRLAPDMQEDQIVVAAFGKYALGLNPEDASLKACEPSFGIHPEMVRPAILNRSMPSAEGSTMSNPAFQGRPSCAFQRFVNLSMRNAIYRFGKSIPDGEQFFQRLYSDWGMGSQGLSRRRKLCKAQPISTTISRIPETRSRQISLRIRQRLTLLLTCSI